MKNVLKFERQEEIRYHRVVSERALAQRINRRLARDGERLCRQRGLRGDMAGFRWPELGEYYITDDRNCIVAQEVSVETIGRELGVLQPHERVLFVCDCCGGSYVRDMPRTFSSCKCVQEW